MEGLLHTIVELLTQLGPWIIFAVALSETAVFLGLLVPAEATVLLGGFLADRGVFPVEQILAAAFFGGLLGDQIGYLLGRKGGGRLVARGGWTGRVWRRYERAASALFRRHAGMAITLARFISFVRTLMPWFAGMSGVPYGRFLVYDVLGVLGWAGASVAVGYLAGESWELVASTLGTVSAVIVGLLVLVAAWAARRGRRAGEELAEAAEEGEEGGRE